MLSIIIFSLVTFVYIENSKNLLLEKVIIFIKCIFVLKRILVLHFNKPRVMFEMIVCHYLAFFVLRNYVVKNLNVNQAIIEDLF